MGGPLAGIRVIDCTRGTAGPRATGILADYGADVIWVEPPGGDPYREALAIRYSVYQRGKRSVVLDLHDDGDHERFTDLVRSADVLVESWRPGVAARLGADHAAVHAIAPWVVTTSITGFGVDGPLADVRGHEPLVHALVGTMGEQRGWREGPIFEGLPFASLGASSLAVIGMLAALYRRADDGVGRHVETSLFDGALAYLTMGWADFDVEVPALMGPRLEKRLIVRSFECGDGEWLGVHTGAVGAFGRCMEALGLDDRVPPSPDGLDMALTPTPEEQRILDDEVPALLASEPREVWLKRLLDHDVCAIPVLRPTESYDAAQPRHNRMVRTVHDPVLGAVEQVSPPAAFSRTPVPDSRPAPLVGEHTRDVLADLVPRDIPSSAPDGRPLLDGVNVLDFGAYYAGPYANRLLADLGAEVIKLETLAGDPLRGQVRVFPSGHAGKRSIAADLKHADGQEIGRRLAGWADVVAHNMRPGAAERLGLGYEQVAATNPDIVYAYSPGWGSTGPDRRRQGFAPMYSGFTGVSFEVAGSGNPPTMPAGNEDPGNGLLGAIGILMALVHRRLGGRGQYLEHPQVNATMGHLAHIVRRPDGEVLGAAMLDREQLGTGPLERLYRTADGWVCVVAPDQETFVALCRAFGCELLADDPRFATAVSRTRHADDLADALATAAASLSTGTVVDALGAHRVPHAVPLGYNCESFLRDVDNRRSGRAVESPHATKGRVREVGRTVRISDAAVAPHRPAPELGEHTDEILAGLGYDDLCVADLRTRGVVR